MDHETILKKIPLTSLFTHVGRRLHKMESTFHKEETADTKSKRVKVREEKRAMMQTDVGPSGYGMNKERDEWEIASISDAKFEGDNLLLLIEWDFTKEHLMECAVKGQKIQKFSWEPIDMLASNCDAAVASFVQDFVSTKAKCKAGNKADHTDVRRRWNEIQAERNAAHEPQTKRIRRESRPQTVPVEQDEQELSYQSNDEPSHNETPPKTKMDSDEIAERLKKSEEEKAAVQKQLADLIARQAAVYVPVAPQPVFQPAPQQASVFLQQPAPQQGSFYVPQQPVFIDQPLLGGQQPVPDEQLDPDRAARRAARHANKQAAKLAAKQAALEQAAIDQAAAAEQARKTQGRGTKDMPLIPDEGNQEEESSDDEDQ
eukprot:jgi/Mesvir1/24426/Mv21641-RA.1